jgi:hypothetical protein
MWDGHEYVPLSPPPTSGTWSLDVLEGQVSWEPGIPVGEIKGQMIFWRDVWKLTEVGPKKSGQFFVWDETLESYNVISAPTQQGQLLRWNDTLKNWVPLSGTTEGQLLQWDATEGWQADIGGSSNGQLLNFNNETKKWQTFTPHGEGSMIYFKNNKWENLVPGENSLIYYRNNAWTILTPPATGTYVLGSKDGVMQWIATEEC